MVRGMLFPRAGITGSCEQPVGMKTYNGGPLENQ